MNLLDTLYGLPPPRGAPGRKVMPLGDWDIDPEQERKLARAEACERYRNKNREAVNRRVREWKRRKKSAKS